MKMWTYSAVCFMSLSGWMSSVAFAEETTPEKVETMGNKAADGVKSTYRNAKDEVCEMVNGKMQCVAKKIKNKAKNAADAVDTKANEIKNKVD